VRFDATILIPSFFHDRSFNPGSLECFHFHGKQLFRYYVPHYESYGAIFLCFFFFFRLFLRRRCGERKEGREKKETCDRQSLQLSYQFKRTNRELSVMNGIHTNVGFTSIQRMGMAKCVIRLLRRSPLRASARAFSFPPSFCKIIDENICSHVVCEFTILYAY